MSESATATNTLIISILNDQLRRNLPSPGKLGRLLISEQVSYMDPAKQRQLIQEVAGFTDFSRSNDPNEEHDFGAIDFEGTTYFWKIDYYDRALEYGSENPSNPIVTSRVITIMQASEY